MATEIVMPRMGLTMETGTVLRWLKQEGQPVEAGEPLLEIETDKSMVEIEALASGILGQIIAAPGQVVPVGEVIGYLTQPGEPLPRKGSSIGTVPENLKISGASSPPSPVHLEAVRQKTKASPAARRLAKDLSIPLEQVAGTGPGGRVVASNVQQAATALPRVSPVARRLAADLGVDLASVRGTGPGGQITRSDVEQAKKPSLSPALPAEPESPLLKPLTRLQRVMSERMTYSFTSAPHFYLHAEVNARALTELRDQLRPVFESRHSQHLTFTDLLVLLSAKALRQHPQVLAQWSPEGLLQFTAIHIGIAVDTEEGLLVPVIRHADRLGLLEITRQRTDLVERARQGKLLPSDYEAGVFTITNLGSFRVDAFDAILNPPQAAILAVGRIKERALVENGQLTAAPAFTLSLSVDHRVLDGARAARFLGDLVDLLEMPSLAIA